MEINRKKALEPSTSTASLTDKYHKQAINPIRKMVCFLSGKWKSQENWKQQKLSVILVSRSWTIQHMVLHSKNLIIFLVYIWVAKHDHFLFFLFSPRHWCFLFCFHLFGSYVLATNRGLFKSSAPNKYSSCSQLCLVMWWGPEREWEEEEGRWGLKKY